MNRKSKKAAKPRDGATEQRPKAGSKQPLKARPKRTPELEPIITPEDHAALMMTLMMTLPAGQLLLWQIEQEVKDIADEEANAQARVVIAQSVEARLAEWDAEAMLSEEGQRIHSRHLFARWLAPDDPHAKRLEAGIQFLELLDSQMAARSLPEDSVLRMTIAFGIQLKTWLFCQHVANRFTEAQRGLVMALLSAICSYAHGERVRCAVEKKRELTKDERAELTKRLIESVQKYLPAIVDQLMPDEFEAYVKDEFPVDADNVRGPGRPPKYTYAEAATNRYLDLWPRHHRRKSYTTRNIDKEIVKQVRRELHITDSYITVHRVIRREIAYRTDTVTYPLEINLRLNKEQMAKVSTLAQQKGHNPTELSFKKRILAALGLLRKQPRKRK